MKHLKSSSKFWGYDHCLSLWRISIEYLTADTLSLISRKSLFDLKYPSNVWTISNSFNIRLSIKLSKKKKKNPSGTFQRKLSSNLFSHFIQWFYWWTICLWFICTNLVQQEARYEAMVCRTQHGCHWGDEIKLILTIPILKITNFPFCWWIMNGSVEAFMFDYLQKTEHFVFQVAAFWTVIDFWMYFLLELINHL